MVSNNIPQVKLGIIAVSRDCFPIALSTQRRENIVKEYKGEIFNCQTTVENEKDMLKALGDLFIGIPADRLMHRDPSTA